MISKPNAILVAVLCSALAFCFAWKQSGERGYRLGERDGILHEWLQIKSELPGIMHDVGRTICSDGPMWSARPDGMCYTADKPK
jgi:hypothetical protein